MRATAKPQVVVPFLCLDHVQLAIPPESEASARDFYVDALGFEEISKPPVLAPFGNRIELIEDVAR